MDMNRLNEWAVRHGVGARAMAELMTLYDPPRTVSDETSEAKVQAECRLAAPRLGCSLWRNNSGATVDDTGRQIRYGLENVSKKLNDVFKSPDLVGIARGRFIGVECKPPGWNGPASKHEQAQANFGRTIESLGGVFMFCTDAGQFVDKVNSL
jgi:hypothetical protein